MKGIIDISEITHEYNIIPHNPKPHSNICTIFGGAICTYGMSFFIDKDPGIDYHGRNDMVMSNLPSGAGWRNYAHYGQLLAPGPHSFKRYDQGTAQKNFDKYGQITPPEYDLKKL